MRLPRRADSVNYFLLGSAAIICIFHLAVIDVAGGREESRRVRHFSLCVATTFWMGIKKKKRKRKMDSLTAWVSADYWWWLTASALNITGALMQKGQRTVLKKLTVVLAKTSIISSFILNWLWFEDNNGKSNFLRARPTCRSHKTRWWTKKNAHLKRKRRPNGRTINPTVN